MALRDDLKKTHNYLPTLAQQFKDGKVSRREFLRTATLLGLSSATAYSIVGLPETGSFTKPARAAGRPSRFGTPYGRHIPRWHRPRAGAAAASAGTAAAHGRAGVSAPRSPPVG